MFRAQSIRRGAAVAVVLAPPRGRRRPCVGHEDRLEQVLRGPFQCGTLQVPLDYDQPNGTTISLAVVRLPATDPAHRIGSLFLNPGGPGGSGVDYTVFAGPELYTPEVRARFDLVGFDPRGIARSTALRCFGNPRQWEPAFTPFAVPDDARRARAVDRRRPLSRRRLRPARRARSPTTWRPRTSRATWTACAPRSATRSSPTPASPTAPTSASPTRTCSRTGSGASSSTACWTRSPGRRAAATRRRRCRSRRGCSSDVGAQATLNEFFRLCDAGGADCAFSGGAAARYAALASAARAPGPDHVPRRDDGGARLLEPHRHHARRDVRLVLLAGLRRLARRRRAPGERPARSAPAPQRFRGTPRLHPQARLPALLQLRSRASPRSRAPTATTRTPTTPGRTPASPPTRRTATSGASGRGRRAICAVWHHTDAARYMGPFNRRTANPVLVVGNLFDPATPYQGAQTVATLLPNSALLTVHGWGHTSLFLSACADEAIARYLVDRSRRRPAPSASRTSCRSAAPDPERHFSCHKDGRSPECVSDLCTKGGCTCAAVRPSSPPRS